MNTALFLEKRISTITNTSFFRAKMHICAGSSESLSHFVMKLCLSTVFQSNMFTNFDSRSWKRERERLHGACTWILFSLGILEYRNTMFGPTTTSDEDPCPDPERFVRGGPTLQLWKRFFPLFRGKRIQISLKAGHHRPVSKTPFKWLFAGATMNAGFVALRIF